MSSKIGCFSHHCQDYQSLVYKQVQDSEHHHGARYIIAFCQLQHISLLHGSQVSANICGDESEIHYWREPEQFTPGTHWVRKDTKYRFVMRATSVIQNYNVSVCPRRFFFKRLGHACRLVYCQTYPSRFESEWKLAHFLLIVFNPLSKARLK